MKKFTALFSLFLFTLVSPLMADGLRRPFEYHGSATRITPEGRINSKSTESHSLRKILAPVTHVVNRCEAPSGRASITDGYQPKERAASTGAARCVSLLCPWTWFRRS